MVVQRDMEPWNKHLKQTSSTRLEEKIILQTKNELARKVLMENDFVTNKKQF